ncbi:MAG: tautomerase family protein [Pseudomonadota bacterium]
MPLYLCNATTGAIPDSAKPAIAKDITRIHCDVTGAPAQFVHAFFVENEANPPLGGKSAMVFGSIRANRTDAQKSQIIEAVRKSIQTHAGLSLDNIGMMTTDVPASWAFEGGEIMPEPGEEAAWLLRHHRANAPD